MTQQAPAPVPPPAPMAVEAAPSPSVSDKRGQEARREWIKQAAQELAVVDPSSEDAEPAKLVRGKNGKFQKKTETTEVSSKATSETSEATDTDSEQSGTEETQENTVEDKQDGVKTDDPDLRKERIELQNAWTKVHREMARLRQNTEQLKAIRGEYQRLASIEQRLKTEPYKVVEEHGGSLGDWQRRTLAGGLADAPQVQDLRKIIEERDRQWQARFDAIEQGNLQKQQSEAIQATEQSFIRSLDEHAEKADHCKAYGKSKAVDMAYDFAEHVARVLRGRKDIPRSEREYIDAYLENTPRALALSPQNIISAINKRLARESGAVRETPTAAKTTSKKVVDNAATGTRAAPSTKDMTREEFVRWAASQISTDGDDD